MRWSGWLRRPRCRCEPGLGRLDALFGQAQQAGEWPPIVDQLAADAGVELDADGAEFTARLDQVHAAWTEAVRDACPVHGSG